MNSTADNRFLELHKQVAALQLQNDALRQKLAAAQAREELEAARTALTAAQAEARELRTQMEQVRQITLGMHEYVDSCSRPSEISKGNAVGYWHAQLEEALSRPAERDVGDDLCWELGDLLLGYLDRLNDPTKDDPLEEIVRELRAEANPIVDQILAEGPGRTAERESLPLMAAREWTQGAKLFCVAPGNSPIAVHGGDDVAPAGYECFRVADTDEHGLPVIERTADMPGWAKYRYRWMNAGSLTFTDEYRPTGSRLGWRRIEDYNERGQEGQGDA